MSDDVDLASSIVQQSLDIALQNRVRPSMGVSPVDCNECGELIEVERRKVVPGTEHCAECAKYFAERNRFAMGR